MVCKKIEMQVQYSVHSVEQKNRIIIGILFK